MIKTVVKVALRCGSGLGAGMVSKELIQKVLPHTTSTIKKGLYFIGGFGISEVVTMAVRDAVSKEVDNLFDKAESIKKAIKEKSDK